MTPEQLASVLDLDLWRITTPGSDEQFDQERFGEWLEALVEAGDAVAARIVAGIDVRLLVAGLSRHIRVLDPAACAPAWWSDDEAAEDDAAPLTGLANEIGGYVIRARRPEAWDAIVRVLLALDSDHHDCFHAVMRGCRRLSNSAPEADGLDDLLTEPDQLLHDVGLDRQRRRSLQGYLTPTEARAFLRLARLPQQQPRDPSSPSNPIAAAYLRAGDGAAAFIGRKTRPPGGAVESSRSAGVSESVNIVADLLAEAGLVPERPRALLEGAVAAPSPFARMATLMAHVREADGSAHLARSREIAFLANAFMAGCSVQSRAFTVREASDAALATCSLGLDDWAARWLEAEPRESAPTADRGTGLPATFLVDHDLVTAFQAGWAALHDVSMFVAGRLIVILKDLRCADAEIQAGLNALRRELVGQRDAGTPWLARDALDVVATLDAPAWIGLLGLLDECPVLPAAVAATLEGRTGAVSATAFEFISTALQIGQVRAFLAKLPDVLLG